MGFEDYVDMDVIASPAYWLLTIGAAVALLLGFKMQDMWNTGLSIPIYSMIGILVIIPVVAYFIVRFNQR